MKRSVLLPFVLFLFLLVMAGCGGSSSDSATPPEDNLDPSATDYPFGVRSMTVPYGDNTTTLEFSYDSQGRVIEASNTVERDSDGDDRVDSIQTVVYTIDPTISVSSTPEVDGISLAPLSVSRSRGVGSSFMLTTTLGDIPGGVTRIETQAHSYNSSARSVDVPDDMVLTRHITITYSYDSTGRMTQAVYMEEDYNSIDTQTIDCTFNADGHLVLLKRVYQYDLYKDDWVEENDISETTYVYDENGYKVSKIEDEYSSEYLRSTTYSYNESGLLSGEDYRRTQRGGDRVYEHDSVVYSYDAAGRLTQEIRSDYSVDEEGTETLNYVNTITYSYDGQGRVSEKTREYDGDGNPATANDTYTDTYTFGPYGLTGYSYVSEYSYGGGSTYTYTYTYNDQGRLTGRQRMRDSDNDGVADYFDIDTYTYDDVGRLVSIENAYHPAVDGEPGTATDIERYSFTYDADGRLTEYVFDDLDNGVDVDSRMISTAVYNEAGTAATGTVSLLEWDVETETFVPLRPVQESSFSFAAGAPTATFSLPTDQFPYSSYLAHDFEQVTVSFEIPALYTLYYSSLSFSLDRE